VGAHRRGRGAAQGGGSARIAEPRVCRVQPDLPAVARAFDYLVPEEAAGVVRVGTIVRVPLHGRRVRGWVVADAVEPEARRSELRPLTKVVSAGPPAEVVELCRWAAWRYAGPLPLLLRSASPPNVVPPSGDPELHTAVFPRREAPDGIDAGAVDELVTREQALLSWPPGADWQGVVGALVADEASTIVVAPESRRVRALVDELRRCGREVIVVRGNDSDARRTESWDRARAGATVVVGGRVAVLAPVPDLAATLVLDEGDEALKEERAPTWNARELALERARRAGARCTLLSPAPTLESEAATGPPARPTRPFERDGWPRFDVVDLRDEPPGRGLYSDVLTAALHATVDRGARAVCVVNRKGRAQLLVCRQCGHIAQCEVCDAAVAETETGFVCRRCGTERPRVCLHCHSTRFARRRPGVTRVREEMAALLSRVTVAEVDATTTALPSAPVLVGTEAVLHRANAAPAGIELVAFLEFDQELLATRYRAAEQALWLLVRAARVVGGRRGDGRVLVQSRVPDHDVIEASLAADPTIVADAERARRRILGFPPFGGLVEMSGAPDAVDVACSALRAVHGLRVLGPVAVGASSRALVQADSADVLCDALAGVDLTPAREHGRLRVDVDPLRV
jgi:primosomal protein N' (replication factor Y) (superfamily II helicase)